MFVFDYGAISSLGKKMPAFWSGLKRALSKKNNFKIMQMNIAVAKIPIGF